MTSHQLLDFWSFFLETLAALEQENCASVPYKFITKHPKTDLLQRAVLWIGIVLFDADPVLNFCFDAYPDPDRILLEVLHMLEYQIFFFALIHCHDSLHCFIFLVTVIGVIICNTYFWTG